MKFGQRPIGMLPQLDAQLDVATVLFDLTPTRKTLLTIRTCHQNRPSRCPTALSSSVLNFRYDLRGWAYRTCYCGYIHTMHVLLSRWRGSPQHRAR